MKNLRINLPLIWVCQTASPTPHKLEITKKVLGESGLGLQMSSQTIRPRCRPAPMMRMGNLPIYFIAEPKTREHIAFTTPKHIIT